MKKRNMVCIAMICAALFLTACQNSSRSDNSANAGDAVAALPEKEWAYVPEFITVGDNRASYGNMQLLGDTVCYISMVSEDQGRRRRSAAIP